jgi:GNAT superfamily N-acetyltransferase
MQSPSPFLIRPIAARDVDIIAALHATSWRRAYRGILSDAYLDADLEAERRSVWTAKLSDLSDAVGWLALIGDAPAGFVFVRPNEDPTWGTLVDNLHVLAAHQGRGIGRQLLNVVGSWGHTHAAAAPVHLWVFAENRSARGFYARMGGREVEYVDREASDGRALPEYRVAWESPMALHRATEGPTAH